MANNVYAFTALTGGAAGALDAIAGALLATGDLAFGVSGGKIYAYKFNSTSSATEVSPEVIAPDSGSGRWLLANNTYKLGTFSRDAAGNTADVAYTGVGFKPSNVIFLMTINALCYSVGFDDGTNHYAIYLLSTGQAEGCATEAIRAGGNGTYQSGKIKTLDSDGFTLTWTKTSTPTGAMTIWYMAFR